MTTHHSTSSSNVIHSFDFNESVTQKPLETAIGQAIKNVFNDDLSFVADVAISAILNPWAFVGGVAAGALHILPSFKGSRIQNIFATALQIPAKYFSHVIFAARTHPVVNSALAAIAIGTNTPAPARSINATILGNAACVVGGVAAFSIGLSFGNRLNEAFSLR